MTVSDGGAAASAGRVPLPHLGVLVPTVTPLRPDRTVDVDSYARLIDHLIAGGAAGVLALGSSGEAGALAAAERAAAVRAVVAAARGRVHVMVGVPAMGAADAIGAAREYEALGADSLLVAGPFTFPPSQAELGRYLRLVAGAVAIPVVAYDVPSRTHVTLSPALLAELGADGVIAGVKDSSGALSSAPAIVRATAELPGFVRYTGCEEAIDGLLLAGYTGSMPGIANVVPERSVALVRHAAAGEWERAAAVQREVVGLLDLYAPPLPAGASPVVGFFGAVKEALRQLGVIEHSTVSEPFAQPDDGVAAHARAWLERAGVAVA